MLCRLRSRRGFQDKGLARTAFDRGCGSREFRDRCEGAAPLELDLAPEPHLLDVKQLRQEKAVDLRHE